MRVPGSPQAHVWTGLLLALVGVFVAGFAYTGDRAYHLVYIAVAFLGFALLVGGSLLAGHGQANKPRLGPREPASAKPRSMRSKQGRRRTRTRAEAPRPAKTPKPGKPPKQLEVTLACSACGEVFEARGKPPFTATCPSCGHHGRVPKPPRPEPGAEAVIPSHNETSAPVLDLELACTRCGETFHARGRPPFRAGCPHCGELGDVPRPPER